MSTLASRPRSATWRALTTRSVWLRAAKLGLPVGLVQVALNQGDHWLQHQITTGVVLKSILSPLLSFSIALVSAVATHAERDARPPSSAPVSASSL